MVVTGTKLVTRQASKIINTSASKHKNNKTEGEKLPYQSINHYYANRQQKI